MGPSKNQPPQDESVPFWQVFFDDIFLLLALGLTIPVLFYLVWGFWDLIRVPLWRP